MMGFVIYGKWAYNYKCELKFAVNTFIEKYIGLEFIMNMITLSLYL